MKDDVNIREFVCAGGFKNAGPNARIGDKNKQVDEYQVKKAKEFIRNNLSKIKTINSSKGSSYGLKHCAERFFRSIGQSVDISNGAFIVAMVEEGYKYKQIGSGINAIFNISSKIKMNDC